jgi:23S rRNA pseudouridine1911/1915/1917 synthase
VPSSPKYVPVPQGLAGKRADAGIAKLLGISRTQAAELLSAGQISQSGVVIDKADPLIEDALLVIELPERQVSQLELTETEVSELEVIFQDEHLVVVNKPAGVAAHPSVGWQGPTVGGALLARGIHLATSGAQERQGIVQRLDVGTSGLMVLAKGERAYSVLKQAFRDRTVSKTYHAVVQGHPDPSSATIDSPIARSQRHDYKFTVAADGKPSVTHYRTLELFAGAALMSVGLETGRTHQIRVHFSAFGHPLVGDPLYGSDPKLATRLGLDRQWLHAVELEFAHPISGDAMKFHCGYPTDLENALATLRGV